MGAHADREAWTLLAIGLVFIGIRMYARWTLAGPASFQLDDYLMPIAGLVFAADTTATYLVPKLFDGLTNSYMTPDERAALDPRSEEYYNRVWGSKLQVVGWSIYTLGLYLVKFCVAAFYERLTTGLIHLPVQVRFSYALLTVTYLATALTIVLSCQPMQKFWQINPDPGLLCQPTRSPAYVLMVLIPNIITDIYLMSIPMPLLWTVNIRLKRKISLMILFSGGIFVIMASIIRAVVILSAGPDGAVSGSKWAVREIFVSVIVSNLPIISPLIRRNASRIGLSRLFSTGSRPSDQQESGYALPGRGNASERGKKRARHPLSIPGNGTAWGSDEQILGEEEQEHERWREDGGDGGGDGRKTGITVTREMRVESMRVQSRSQSQNRPDP